MFPFVFGIVFLVFSRNKVGLERQLYDHEKRERRLERMGAGRKDTSLRYDDRSRRVCLAEFLKLIGTADFGKPFGSFGALIAESALAADNWNWFPNERELGKSGLFLGGCFLDSFELISERSLTEEYKELLGNVTFTLVERKEFRNQRNKLLQKCKTIIKFIFRAACLL